MYKKVLSILLVGIFLLTSVIIFGTSQIEAATVDSIPSTSRTIKSYDNTFLSVTGYASLGVKERNGYIGTSYYRKVRNEKEFLQAILDAGKNSVKVIEVTDDLNLGWKELNLSSSEISKYSFITKYPNPTNGFTNPILKNSGVSKLNISNVNGLTIFSPTAKTIKHAEFKLQSSSKDIVIRNLNFDDMWQWDDVGNHKEVGWTFIKVNGANNVWIDHCKFSIAADGIIDIENGSSNITFSWCDFGLAANEKPASTSSIYQSINYMEQKYTSNQLRSTSLYYKMRKGGATKNQIMAYAAYHSKGHLVGSGDKDYMNYVNSSGVNYYDGNQRLRLTMAYCNYTNIGQRLPMIRQGSGHLFNCYFDNSSHFNVLNSVSAIKRYATDTLSRGINSRNGASIAADTCIYNGINEPIIGAEIQGQDTRNMDAVWAKLFKNAYNHSLIVNSQVSNSYGTYTGSSWDNNGDNLFTKGFTWYNKSTINKWAWSSSIVGVENMSKENPPSVPFTFQYNYTEKLPYTYNVLPLNNVISTLKNYSGAGKINLSTKEWLKTSYTSSSPNSDINTNIYYSIKNKLSGKVVDVDHYSTSDGAAIIQWTDKGTANQKWKFIDLGNGYYKIKNQNSGKYMEVESQSRNHGAKIIQNSNDNSDSQCWQIVNVENGYYKIVNKFSGLALDNTDGSKTNGTKIQQWGYDDNDNQKWLLK